LTKNYIENTIRLKEINFMEESQDILQKALDLALAVYRLTNQLPKNEVMIGQLRKLSNELIGDLMMDNFVKYRKRTELLMMYFKISRDQNWVRDVNWQILEKEYQKLSRRVILFEKAGEEAQTINEKKKRVFLRSVQVPIRSHNTNTDEQIGRLVRENRLSARQQKILEEMKISESIKMSDLIPLFKNTASERTIRNDLQILLKRGLIDKTGTHKTTVYFLKK
jgi:hypothetical protein